MRLTRIYTRTGDDGTTRLADGTVVSKDSPRVRAYGAVDELNSWIGVVVAAEPVAEVGARLSVIQNELFDLGADLATPVDADVEFPVPRITADRVAALEAAIDELNAVVGPLRDFVLPGGSVAAAWLHVARTVCRRAEREVVELGRAENLGDEVTAYLNRLSDALFVMARFENHRRGVAEPLWQHGDAPATDSDAAD